MELNEITKIQEISTEGFTADDAKTAINTVNELLKQKWVLLKIYTTCYDEDFPNQQIIHYVLGLPADANVNSSAYKPIKLDD